MRKMGNGNMIVFDVLEIDGEMKSEVWSKYDEVWFAMERFKTSICVRNSRNL